MTLTLGNAWASTYPPKRDPPRFKPGDKIQVLKDHGDRVFTVHSNQTYGAQWCVFCVELQPGTDWHQVFYENMCVLAEVYTDPDWL